MKKRTLRLVVPAIAGALTGAVVVFLLLAALGARQRPAETGEPTSAPTAEPTASLSPMPRSSPTSEPSPSAEAEDTGRVVTHERGGYRFTLPTGYRVAREIVELDASQSPDVASFTITRGSEAQERSYVELIQKLQRDGAATEAPVFRPGETITILTASHPNLETSDAQLARSKTSVTTRTGLSGTRYRRVEGLFTYDMTYLTLPGGKKIAVQMAYASSEPLFDEAAYQAVLDSLEPI